ncbi:MAG TPA: hypothetical protein VIP75_12845 [Acidothermales bacterium]
MSNTDIPRYNFVKAWPRALRLALIVFLFLLAIIGGMAVAARTATPSADSAPAGAAVDSSAVMNANDSGTEAGGGGSGGGGSSQGGQDGDDAEPAPDPEPEPDPDPKFDGPDDLAPNPGPEPTPPDDLAPNPDPDPDPVGADDIAAAPEPGTLKVHPNFAEVTLHGKGYENAEYVCFGNPGDLSVHWIVNDGVVIKSNPLNGDLEAGAVTCPLVWTDYWELEPGDTQPVVFESENNFILIEVTLAE